MKNIIKSKLTIVKLFSTIDLIKKRIIIDEANQEYVLNFFLNKAKFAK